MIFDNPVIKEDMEDIYSSNIPFDKLRGSSVLVTGAYGMLASYLVYFLAYLNLYKGFDIRIIANGRSKAKSEKRFSGLLDEPWFVLNHSDVSKGISEIDVADYIVHAASPANPRLYSTNPVEVLEPNVIGTFNLLHKAVEWKSKGFLFFSSGDVYGSVDNPSQITEETIGRLNHVDEHSCYSEGKRAGESFCKAFYREYGVPAMSARIGHSYGPTMNVEEDPRVFASFLKCALDGEDIMMHSDGLSKRPFCYISDAVKAFLIILLKGEAGEAYNVCNDEQFLSIGELAEIVSGLNKETKLSVKYKERNNKDSYTENRDNIDNCPRSDKLRSIGWRCNFTVADGMKRTFEYLKGQK